MMYWKLQESFSNEIQHRGKGEIKPTLSRVYCKVAVVQCTVSEVVSHCTDEETEAQRGLATSHGHKANE